MIPITYLRSSAYNTHDFCPLRHFSEYVLGWSGPGNKKADKGTIVHKALELLACAKKAAQEGKEEYKDKECFGTLSSDTSLIDIDQLTEEVYAHYSKVWTHHKWTHRDLTDCRAWVWKTLEFNNGAFDPRNRIIVDAEPHFDFEIKEDWAKYRYELTAPHTGEDIVLEGYWGLKGTIDLVTELSPGVYEIIDWKTGKRWDWAKNEEKTFDKLRDDPQLRMYHYAAQVLYPNIDNILVTIFFINDGGPFTLDFGRAEIPKTVDMLRKKFELIKNTKVPKKNKSWKCNRFCHQGTTTFEGTSIKPLVEYRPRQVTKQGEYMTKCEQISYVLQHRPIDLLITHMTAPGYDIVQYKAPGSTE